MGGGPTGFGEKSSLLEGNTPTLRSRGLLPPPRTLLEDLVPFTDMGFINMGSTFAISSPRTWVSPGMKSLYTDAHDRDVMRMSRSSAFSLKMAACHGSGSSQWVGFQGSQL